MDQGKIGSIEDNLNLLVSAKTGIIKNLELFSKDFSEPNLPIIVRSELSNHNFLNLENSKQFLECSGKGFTKLEARISALGEAVERYSGATWLMDEIKYSRRSDLKRATLDPNALVLYDLAQYDNVPYAPYRDDTVMGWVTGYSLTNEQQIEVPSIAVFMNYQVKSQDEHICSITSNGLAAGPTMLDAILNAALEVIERDAFMNTWLLKPKCIRIDPKTHPNKNIVELCKLYERRKVNLHLYKLPTDNPCHAFMCIGYGAKGESGPAIVVGLGADLDASRAAKQAILEVGQVRPGLKRRMRTQEGMDRVNTLLADPTMVTELEDHDLLYTRHEKIHAFDFLAELSIEPFDWEHNRMTSQYDKLDALNNHFKKVGNEIIYINLTPPDMEALNLYTARVIIPGYQPIHFGYNERRLGGQRLFELPVKLGFSKHKYTIVQLNKDPHPLA